MVFAGAKRLLTDLCTGPIGLARGVIALVLGASMLVSLLLPQRATAHDPVIHGPLEPKPYPAVAPIKPNAEGSGERRTRGRSP